MFKYLCIFLGVFLISSCASTGVVPLGQNSHYVGKKDGSPDLGVSLKNNAKVYSEARQFCDDLGFEMKILKETVTPAAPARLGSTELEFSCVPKGSLETPTEEKPDQIIENRVQRIRLDRDREAIHDLNRLLDKPGY